MSKKQTKQVYDTRRLSQGSKGSRPHIYSRIQDQFLILALQLMSCVNPDMSSI